MLCDIRVQTVDFIFSIEFNSSFLRRLVVLLYLGFVYFLLLDFFDRFRFRRGLDFFERSDLFDALNQVLHKAQASHIKRLQICKFLRQIVGIYIAVGGDEHLFLAVFYHR